MVLLVILESIVSEGCWDVGSVVGLVDVWAGPDLRSAV